MKFGEITHVSGAAFYVSQLSGILGLAYATISVNHLPTFIDTSNLEERSFSFYLNLNPEESYMTIPGYDQELMKDREFSYHRVIEQKYYSVNISSIEQKSKGEVGGIKINTKNYKAVIDSGTSVIIGPKEMMSPLLEGISVKTDCSNIDDLPVITFTFDEREYDLEPSDYVLKVSAFGITQCVLGLMPANLPTGFDYFILGDLFMRRYYTFFDKEHNRLGFYDAKKLNTIQWENEWLSEKMLMILYLYCFLIR